MIALFLGLAGLITILGGRTGVLVPQNVGDALALLAGMVWATGSMKVRSNPAVGIFETVFSFFLYGSLVALIIAFLSIGVNTGPPTFTELDGSCRGWFWRQRGS
ncbi:MAG: hypothetical protein R3D34_03675 [Nitratireductor sp.]